MENKTSCPVVDIECKERGSVYNFYFGDHCCHPCGDEPEDKPDPENPDIVPDPDNPDIVPDPDEPDDSDALNPDVVYDGTRPKDWLPMPKPQDNELYLLFHIPDGYSALVAFTATCTGNYTVELGTVTDGIFVPQNAMTQTIASGTIYENELFAENFGALTQDGLKQCMIKVSGTEIKTWKPDVHKRKTAVAYFSAWNIVEISCRLPQAIAFEAGTGAHNHPLKKLRYFAMYGENNITDAKQMFSKCGSLSAVLQLYTGNMINIEYMFNNCHSLVAIPRLDLTKVEKMRYMFGSCKSLRAVPPMDTSNVNEIDCLFYDCTALISAPKFDTGNASKMDSMFSRCTALTSIAQLDTHSTTSLSGICSGCHSLVTLPRLDTSNLSSSNSIGAAFTDCFSLSGLLFNPDAKWPVPQDIHFTSDALSHKAIVDMFESLPTITTSKTITLSGNPGAAKLTAVEQSIAKNKGWKLTL